MKTKLSTLPAILFFLAQLISFSSIANNSQKRPLPIDFGFWAKAAVLPAEGARHLLNRLKGGPQDNSDRASTTYEPTAPVETEECESTQLEFCLPPDRPESLLSIASHDTDEGHLPTDSFSILPWDAVGLIFEYYIHDERSLNSLGINELADLQRMVDTVMFDAWRRVYGLSQVSVEEAFVIDWVMYGNHTLWGTIYRPSARNIPLLQALEQLNMITAPSPNIRTAIEFLEGQQDIGTSLERQKHTNYCQNACCVCGVFVCIGAGGTLFMMAIFGVF